MKQKVLLSFAFLLLSLTTGAITRVDSLLQILHNPKSNYVFVIAHRADWRGAPENSIQGIENAIRMGADMVEIDIARTKDGHFVLMHDETIDRTTEGKGRVADYNLADLYQYTLKSGHSCKTRRHIPTLEEALKACKGRILVNIDKGTNYMKEILPLIQQLQMEKQVIVKGRTSIEKLKQRFDKSTGIPYMPIVDMDNQKAVASIPEYINFLHPIAFEIDYKKEEYLDMKVIKNIVKSGVRVWMNTLWDTQCAGHDDENALIEGKDKHWGWILKHHATMIQTDRPQELIEYLTSKGLRKR